MQSEDGEAGDNESNLVAMVTTLGIDSSFLSGSSSSSSKGDHHSNAGKKNNMKLWNDDYTIKHKLNDLLPPFDPRPGRVNLPQTLDLEIPTPGNNHLYI